MNPSGQPFQPASLCAVCGGAMDRWAIASPKRQPGAADRRPVCGDFTCRAILDGAQLVPDSALDHYLSQAGASHTRRIAQARRAEVEAQQNAEAFAAIEAKVAAKTSPPVLRVVLPTGRGRLRPLSARRRRRFEQHLDAMIAAAQAGGPMAPPPNDTTREAVSPLPGRLCGACGGGCCHSGGDTAYLSPETIRRVMAADPAADPAKIRAAYLDRLPKSAVAGSCVNHTPAGCALPRSLRANICNQFSCEPLAKLEAALQTAAGVGAVAAIQRRAHQWNRTHPDIDNDITGWALLTRAKTSRFGPPKPLMGCNKTRL